MNPSRRQQSSIRRRRFLTAAGWMLVFLGAMALVIWRQTHGVALVRQIRALESEHAIAETERVQLIRDVQVRSRRARIVPLAEHRLGMRLPNDSEIIFLPLPDTSRAPSPSQER